MARLPRLTVPGYPHHVIQRGNNRQMIFQDAADREFMLELLAEHSRLQQVAIHAYVLMGNHFHLLATPQTQDGLPSMMQAVGRSYVRHFNRRQHRTGTLWEGRYRSTIVQSERYLLACMAYIDLNPVRAALVAQAVDYPLVQPRAPPGPARRSAGHPARAVLGAGQHAVRPRGGLRRAGARRPGRAGARGAGPRHACRLGAGRGRLSCCVAAKNRQAPEPGPRRPPSGRNHQNRVKCRACRRRQAIVCYLFYMSPIK